MKVLIVFPGREAFYAGMGVEIIENYPEILPYYTVCKKKIGVDLIEACVYEEEEHDWTIEERQIAVLVTSVAFYHVWKQKYVQISCYLAGEEIGYLSALVCSEAISLAEAIRLIKGNKAKAFRIKKVPDYVISPSTGESASTKKELMEDINYIFDNRITLATYVASAKKYGIECILDIGPNNMIAKEMDNLEERILCGNLDVSTDPNYILEGFEYKKLFNKYYCSLRILGMMVSASNRNESTEEYKNVILESYQFVKGIVDNATIKLFQTGNMEISEADYKECFERLKLVFQNKKTPQKEIERRIDTLEKETLLQIKKQFFAEES